MAIRMFGDWKKAVKLMATARTRFIPAVRLAMRREGVLAQNLMRKNLGTGQAQSEMTRVTGGGGKPLIRSEPGLRGSINVVMLGSMSVFIGVPRADGKYQIAVVHEEGRVIVQPLTDKMRAFLIHKLSELGDPPSGGGRKMVLVTQIPARPFIGPAIKAVSVGFTQRFERTFARALRGDYGRI